MEHKEEITVQDIIDKLIAAGIKPTIETVCDYCREHKLKLKA